MTSLAQTLSPGSQGISAVPESGSETSNPSARASARGSETVRLLVAILTTSASLHLLIVGFLGRGIPAEIPRLKPHPTPPPEEKVYENLQLESAPPPPPKTPVEVIKTASVAPETLPEIGPTPVIAAIPATVKVDFAVLATGPVHIVNTIAEASGGAALAIPDGPISLETQGARGQLLSPQLPYPPEAHRRHLSGTVVIEFRATAVGDVYDVRVRTSSGHPCIDDHARERVRRSRWTGAAGYYAIPYDYISR